MKKLRFTTLLFVFIWSLAPQSWAACSAPTGLAASEIASNSATISWDAVPDALKYAVKVQNAPSTPTYEISVALGENRLELLGLEPDGEYLFKVKAWCRNGEGSDFSAWFSFRTSPGSPPPSRCATPAGLAVSDITPSGAKLSWDGVPGALKYELELIDGGNYFLNVFIGETSFPATRLEPNTNFKFRVRAWCGNGERSGFSNWENFSTASSGFTRFPGSSTVRQFEAYPNPAHESLKLRFPEGPADEAFSVKIFNAQGQMYLAASFAAYEGQSQEVSVASLPDGMYFITAEGKGGALMQQKVMISHW